MKCLIVVFAAALVSTAVAEGPAAKRNPDGAIEPVVRAALNPKLAEKLGVTEEQATKLKALKDGKDGMKELNEKVRKGMERQAELLKADQVDEAAVMAALDEVWEARKEVAKRQTKRLIAVRSILKPDQIAKAREALKSLKKDGGRRRCKGGDCEKPKGDAEGK